MIKNTLRFLSLALRVQLGPGHVIVIYSRSHTIRHTKKGMDSSQGVISSSQSHLPTQHNKHKRRKFMGSVGSEPAIPTIRKLQTYALDYTGAGIGHSSEYIAISDRFMGE